MPHTCNSAVVHVSASVIGVAWDVLWVAGSTDFIEGINQGVLILGLERNVEVDRGFSGRVAQTFPVYGDRSPCMLHPHVTPMLGGCRECAEGPSGEGGEYCEQVAVYNY